MEPAALNRLTLVLAICSALAQAQSGPPFFTIDSIVADGLDRHTSLAPGMLVSIYGANLGPQQSCEGLADTHNREKPNPGRQHQLFVETLIYPKELCRMQVLVGDTPAGLLYVHGKQINFKVPQEAPIEGTTQIRVIRDDVSSAPVIVKLGLETVLLSVDGEARVHMPVWIKVSMPSASGRPGDFACNAFEVRRNGVLLTPIPHPPPNLIAVTGNFGCGFPGLPEERMHDGRFPLHLQYRFDAPGAYEVRYTLRSGGFVPQPNDILARSEWTRIDIT